MPEFPLMLWVKLPVDEIIDPESKFGTGVEHKATGHLKLNGSPVSKVTH